MARLNSVRRELPYSMVTVWATILVLFFFAIVFSSVELSSYPHGTMISPWSFSLPTLSTGALLLSSVFFLQWRTPELGYTITFCLLLLSSGMFYLRFPILDELILVAAVCGVFMSHVVGIKASESRPCGGIWAKIFCLWMFYLAAMSFVGLVYTGNIKAVRFLVVYSALIIYLGNFFFYSSGFRRFDAIAVLLWTGLGYYILNFLNIGYQIYIGFFQEVFEGIGSAGSAYQNFISIVVLPTSFVAISLGKHLRLATFTLLLGAVIGVVGDSRAAVLPLLLCGSIALIFAPSIRLYSSVAVGIFVTSVAGSLAYDNVYWVIDTITSIVGALDIGGVEQKVYYGEFIEAGKGDTGRFAYAISPFFQYVETPWLALTGLGSYSYFPVARESFAYLLDLLDSPALVINEGYSLGGISEPPRPPAFGAYIMEFGIVGVCFFLYCAISLFRNLFKQFFEPGRPKALSLAVFLYLLSIPVCGFLWTYFGEVQDVVFFFLIFSPLSPCILIASQILDDNR